jgi:hypothetical protein
MTRSEAGRLGAAKTNQFSRQRSIDKYYKNPIFCLYCNALVPLQKDKPPSRQTKKFCNHSCSAKFNNSKRATIKVCRCCQTPLANQSSTFCGHACHHQFQYEEFIQKWRTGDTLMASTCDGLFISSHIRRYMFEKYNSKCCKCGWAKTNPVTGKIPLVVNHINGDSTNNEESNLELICPCCDSLTPTYMGLNRGKGREARRKKRQAAKNAVC